MPAEGLPVAKLHEGGGRSAHLRPRTNGNGGATPAWQQVFVVWADVPPTCPMREC